MRSAGDVDEIARCLIRDLGELPGVVRVGVALTEGGGRRLKFTATDRATESTPESTTESATGPTTGGGPEWCHIDAYDDVPLTAVVRTGEPVLGDLDHLERQFTELVAHERERGVRALSAWPLPGLGSPIGGLIVFYDSPQPFTEQHRSLMEATARRVAEAVRRVRVTSGRGPGDATPDDPALVGSGERRSLLLEGDPRAPGAARQFLRAHLAEWGVDDDLVETAQLCLSEMVTNVVMHARTSSELTLHLEAEVLTVVVRDLGGSSRAGDPTMEVALGEDDDPLGVSGRGLMLVDALADRWGSEADASGTTAWFALELASVGGHSSRTG
nr:ATP-binding protein [Nocardioides panaciterrulae]